MPPTFRKALIALVAAASAPAMAQTGLTPDQIEFRALYKELVETNTQWSNGNCTKASEQLAARMKAAGYRDDELKIFFLPEKAREGGLVATLAGTSKKAKPILLLGHIDVVEARREDWTRDPYTLYEEDGYFYARGVADDKAMSAIWADTMIRYKKEGYRPKRTLKMALTCGEESNGVAFNGAEWLARNKPDWISAEFALNEGGGGRVGPDGKRTMLGLQVGEKATRNYTLEATNPGGHSSVPRPDNAVYDLTAAVTAVGKFGFPIQINGTTKAFFTQIAPTLPLAARDAALRIAANPNDAEAAAILTRDPTFNSTLRTTCVATMLDAGHAPNALAQRARATVNCRIFPGVEPEAVRKELERVIANPRVSVTMNQPTRPMAIEPPLNPKVLDPARKLGEQMFPGVPMLLTMLTGATDATYTGMIGIPTYGVPGIFHEADGGGVHGLNERIRVKSVYDGRDYLYRLVKLYGAQD
jgi:acetylornithine deacetylase/succinyl-diaminopimelate desuccinylase-like protein